MKNLLVAQSGGPTAAINATLIGIYNAAKNKVDNVYGARYGIKGLLNKDIHNLSKLLNENNLPILAQTPACALGSCRYKLKDPQNHPEQYESLIKVLREYSINYFVYIGGNDSMDTVNKIATYLKQNNISDIIVVGAPKTIDNDLVETDHCPGFGSAAKYIATTIAELERDCAVYSVPAVTLVEIMGRDAGWLTAAAALSRLNGSKGPSLIYCCEKAFNTQLFLSDVEKIFQEKNNSILVALSEGIHDNNGRYISETTDQTYLDEFGHKQNAGAAQILEQIVKKEFGCKTRSIEINLMQRAAAHISSSTDINESIKLGEQAVKCALNEMNGEMSIILRKNNDPYEVEYSSINTSFVANKVKHLPNNMISSNGNDVTNTAIEYLKPLIQGEPNIKYKNGMPLHLNLFK